MEYSTILIVLCYFHHFIGGGICINVTTFIVSYY